MFKTILKISAVGIIAMSSVVFAGELHLRNGKRIVTKGPWKIKGQFVEYTGKDGNLYRLPLKLINQKRSTQKDPKPKLSEIDKVIAKAKAKKKESKKQENIHNLMDLEDTEFRTREETKITDDEMKTYIIKNHDFYGYRKEVLLFNAYYYVMQDDPITLAKILEVNVPLNESETRFSDPILVYAARRGNPKIMTLLLNAGADANQLNQENETALLVTLAGSRQHAVPITKLLLDHKANPNIKDKSKRTALQFALISRWAPEVTALLLDHNALPNEESSQGFRPLTLAIQQGNLKTAFLLFEAGATTNYKDKSGQTPIYLAMYNGDYEFIEPLVKRGAQINEPVKGITPLMLSITQKKLPLTKKLLEWGADPNLETQEGSPARLAIDQNNADFIKALLDNKLKRSSFPGYLCYAAEKGATASLKTLLKRGADPDSKNEAGDPAIVLAARNGHLEVVKRLVEAGADVSQKSASGYSAYVEAKGPNSDAIKEIIRSGFKK